MPERTKRISTVSRRGFLHSCAAAALISTPLLESWGAEQYAAERNTVPAQRILSLDRDWLFGGKLNDAALQPGFEDGAYARITLPHCVTPLSWQNWNPTAWQDVWIYRRHFAVPQEWQGLRLLLHFDRVMAGATPVLNGHSLPQHLGGFLPFEYEVTGLVREQDNVLSVAVDSRWLNVPPAGSPRGPAAADYLLPGGISGSVSLRAVPAVFIREVFAKPMDVLQSNRRVEVTCQIDAATPPEASMRLTATLRKDVRTVAAVSQSVRMEKTGQELKLTLSNLGNILLWSTENPHMYDLKVSLSLGDKPIHHYATRIGFREARFDVDGFFLNGNRTRIFGLNRHELFPYAGFSAPQRLLRRDAEILRRDFNCNTVRCSHYPQSEAFLDACDELGLMVWEEMPGWQYIGDDNWQELALHDVDAMVRRDRNHPSIIVWGVRINESQNDPALYERTQALAKSLDDSRPTSGTMTVQSRENWHEDIYAFDDYHSAPDGSVGIAEPLPDVPYLVSETVGQFNYGGKGFGRKYRRAGDPALQSQQALFHAQAHNKAAAYPRCAGVIAWCAFDYDSLMNAYQAVKCPGVADVFRIPKLGAAFYLAQVDPAVRPVIEPDFYWDFGPKTPNGPGEHAAIFSNCDRLELLIDDKTHAVLHPDLAGFTHLKYPPFFADLKLDGAASPELRIDGFVGQARVFTRSFSSDRSSDRLWLHADEAELRADGSDATQLVFRVVDKFGAPRPFAEGEVSLSIEGPGDIVGDNPFQFADSGGAGAVWIRTVEGREGIINVTAKHPFLGSAHVRLQSRADSSVQ
jgi:beta-galactosidase